MWHLRTSAWRGAFCCRFSWAHRTLSGLNDSHWSVAAKQQWFPFGTDVTSVLLQSSSNGETVRTLQPIGNDHFADRRHEGHGEASRPVAWPSPSHQVGAEVQRAVRGNIVWARLSPPRFSPVYFPYHFQACDVDISFVGPADEMRLHHSNPVTHKRGSLLLRPLTAANRSARLF